MAPSVEGRTYFVCPREGEAGRPQAGRWPVYISPNTRAHRPPRSEPPQPPPRPCANKCTDKSLPHGAVASTRRDRTGGARSARTDGKLLHNPAPRSRKSPAISGPRSWQRRIPTSSAGHPNPHCEESTPRGAQPPARPPPRKSAHARDGGARWERGPAAHDSRLKSGWWKARSR